MVLKTGYCKNFVEGDQGDKVSGVKNISLLLTSQRVGISLKHCTSSEKWSNRGQLRKNDQILFSQEKKKFSRKITHQDTTRKNKLS